MKLPGRLAGTSLGDVLAALHRARLTGTLELAEASGATHRITLRDGLVSAVEVDGATTPFGEMLRRDRVIDDDVLRRSVLRSLSSKRLLGEVLVTDFRVSEAVVGAALRRQVLARLRSLEQIGDARIHFRVALRPPKSALDGGLEGHEFLPGSRRARDSRPADDDAPASAARPRMTRVDVERLAALQLLELDEAADADSIRRAYRRLAREAHPDLHPAATREERTRLEERFIAVTRAYRTLVA